MNIRNTVQLALFVCGINKEANTIQELAEKPGYSNTEIHWSSDGWSIKDGTKE
jgi:hypothetical protein